MSVRHSGSACKTCRRRGRKCTRELPKCRSCLDKGIDCEGYVLKWSGLASRGKLVGKSFTIQNPPASARASAASPPSPVQVPDELGETRLQNQTNQHLSDDGPRSIDGVFSTGISGAEHEWQPLMFDNINTNAMDFEADILELADYSSSEMTDQTLLSLTTVGPTVMSNLWDMYNIPPELKFILDYHFLEVSPRLCVDHTTMRNPYAQYILPLAVERPALLYACAALAACHFDVRLATPQLHVDCLKFRGKAMRRLQEQLWSETSAKDESNLATILMLTLSDICMGGFSNFEAHFAAAKRLIDLRGNNKTEGAFVEQYLAWLNIMSATCTLRKPRFTIADTPSLIGGTGDWSYDVIPCPVDQFEILTELVDLYNSVHDFHNPATELQVQQMKARLLTLPMHNERGEHWLHVTEAYRSAIALFAIRLFQLSTDEDEISWLTQNVFYHSKLTPASTGWADHLLWPLFYAGLEIRDSRRQEWIKGRAKLMQSSGGFRNVETVTNILDRVWAKGERPDHTHLLCSGDLGTLLPV